MGRLARRAAAELALAALCWLAECALAVAGPRPASAEPRIVASGDCFDGPAVLEIEREVGGLALGPDVSLRLAEVDGQIEINVSEGGHPLGTRSIDAGSAPCPDVLRAAALALGLALSDMAIAKAAIDEPAPRSRDLPAAAANPLAVKPPAAIAGPDLAQAPVAPSSRPLQVGLSAEVGVGVAFTAFTSMIATLAADAAYASGDSWSPEVSGRAGVLASFPSRTSIDEVDVWPASYAARVDGCGGLRAEDARLRACGSVVAGALAGEGIQTDALVALGARLEGTWRASPRVGLFLAVDALSVVRPLWMRSQPGDFSAVAEEMSDLSLLFSSGSSFDWL